MSLAAAVHSRLAADNERARARQVEIKAQSGITLDRLDELVTMSRDDPGAFAQLDADTRRLVGLRAANLANRTTTTGAAA